MSQTPSRRIGPRRIGPRRIALTLLALPVAVVLGVLAALNAAPIQARLPFWVARLSAGQVTLRDVSGFLPAHLRIAQLALHDRQGVWLTAEHLRLDWSPAALLIGQIRVSAVSAARLTIARPPIPAAAGSGQSGLALPKFGLSLGQITLDEIDLGAPLLGQPARLGATATARLTHGWQRGEAALTLIRQDRPGRYALTARLHRADIAAALTITEPPDGLIATSAGLGPLGPATLRLRLAGPPERIVASLDATLAGLSAEATGTLNLPARRATLHLSAHAPTLARDGVGLTRAAITADLSGPIAAPTGTARLDVARLTLPGATLSALRLQLAARPDRAALDATADLALPGPLAPLAARGPITLHATTDPRDRTHAIAFTLTQALGQATGMASLSPPGLTLTLALPALSPLAAAFGQSLDGRANLTAQVRSAGPASFQLGLDGSITTTQSALLPRILLGTTRLHATATDRRGVITLSDLSLHAPRATLDAHAHLDQGVLGADWQLDAPDLSALSPLLRGRIAAHGTVSGPFDALAARIDAAGLVGDARFAPAPLTLALDLAGLPSAPLGTLRAHGTLLGAPLDLDLALTPGPRLAVQAAHWRSLSAAGSLTPPDPATGWPTGTLDFSIGRLADLTDLTGQKLAGQFTATLHATRTGAQLSLAARGVGVAGGLSAASATLTARAAGTIRAPILDAQLAIPDLRAAGARSSLTLTARGGPAATALGLDATILREASPPAHLTSAARLDLARHLLHLDQLALAAGAADLRLIAPATLTFAPGIAVDHLGLVLAVPGADPARLDLAGTIRPTLALTLTAATSLAIPAICAGLATAPEGQMRLAARLGGSLAAPTGQITLDATGLHLRRGPAASLPPGALTLRATLAGRTAQIQAQAGAGPRLAFTASGTAPLSATAPLDLALRGHLDLGLASPILSALGYALSGQVRLDGRATGTLSAPQGSGTLRLDHADVQDFIHGVHLAAIAGTLQASGQTIRLSSLTARAGAGTLAASGQVSLTGAMPVALRFQAHDATLVDSDLALVETDAALSLGGAVRTGLTLNGVLGLRRVDLNLPHQLPASVVTLVIRRPGIPPPPAAPPIPVTLGLAINAPGRIFIRGQGLDAELGGKLAIGGTSAHPEITGGIGLRHGEYSLAGTTLKFTSGTISFNGTHGVDPALDLVASSETTDMTATLTVGGYASAPTITLSSTPARPQDQVLAALLFGQSLASLTPLQMAEIGAAVAQIAGVGSGTGALDSVRKRLGLDRLSVGSVANQNAMGGQSNTTAALTGGKYIAPGVFLGAKQGLTGQATQAQLQINLTRRLKLNTDVGSGPGGNDAGISYQFQY